MKGSRLRAKGEKIVLDTVDGKKEFELHPMKNKQLLEVVELADKKQGLKAAILMAKYSLNADPKIVNGEVDAFDDEEMDEMEAPFLLEILDIAAKINGLEDMFDFQQRGQQGQLDSATKPESKGNILDKNLEAINRNPAKKLS